MSRGQMRPSQPPRALAACRGGTRRRALCFWQSALFAHVAGANASKPTAARSCRVPRGYASPGPLFLAKRALRACRGGKCVQANRRAPLSHAAVQTRRRAPGFAQAHSSRKLRGQMRPGQPPRALVPCHGGTRRRAFCFWQSALFAHVAGANAPGSTAARPCPMPRGDASRGLLFLAKRALRACRGEMRPGQPPRALAACREETRRRALCFWQRTIFA